MKDGHHNNKQYSSDVGNRMRKRPLFAFIFLSICINSVISLILVYSFTPSAPSDAGPIVSVDLPHLQEIENLLECDEERWDECLQRASQFANSQKVYAQQVATHRSEALQRAIDGPAEYLDIKIFPDLHPAMVPLDPQYLPSRKWDADRAFPDINIAGLPKAGSTQLHTILKNHAEAVQYGKDKEECTSNSGYRSNFEDWDDEPIVENRARASGPQLIVQRELYKYYDRVFEGKRPSGILDPSKRKTVNACYWINDIEISYHYLRPQGKKSIFLFRDPADWLWSAFNFWRIHEIDPKEYGWTKQGEEYRSPELFHELVASGAKTKWGVYQHDYYQQFTINSPRKLVGLFGRENVLFLRNEDLLPAVVDKQGGVLDQLSNFTGLDRSEFDPRTYSVVTNCNDNKGMKTVCNKTRSSSYALSGGREMLPETRTLIYMHFWEECKIWAAEFVSSLTKSSSSLDSFQLCANPLLLLFTPGRHLSRLFGCYEKDSERY
jgi:hypothetical protein